ncbi:PepSY-associated TM helix domain-containing protein [Roseateles sp. DB2]|uniref:PepSY-associated TM helix domain-containing protein n=1 Tax=Roseateles sp. DB2 TaxID=3453717 RepID=UPI003EED7FDC
MKISSDLIKVHKRLHTWVGITAGWLLFVAFFAGALTMFKEPLDRWVHAGAEPVAQAWAQPLDDGLIPELLARQPRAAAEFTLHLRPTEHLVAPISGPRDPGDAAGADATGSQAGPWVAGRDAQGRLQVWSQPPSMLGELVDLLHRTGGIPGTLGDEHLGVYVMGVASVLYFLALVSGLVVLLPTLVKDFFAIRPGANRKRFWLDFHNVLGITSLPFHVVISLTALVFAFHDQFYGALQQVVYGKQPMFSPPALKMPMAPGLPVLPLSRLLQRVQEEAPGFEPTELLFMRTGGPRPMLRVALSHPDALVHGPRTAYLVLQPHTGELINSSMLPGRESGWSLPVNTFFALHFGSFGGEPMRWTYFALGLMGAALFYSGNLLWLESRRKRQRAAEPQAAQPASVRWLAAATVGLCLGCLLAVIAGLLAGKLRQGGGAQAEGLYLGVYYGVWMTSLAWSLWRGAARAAPQLLAACALGSLLLPALSLRSGSGLLAGLGGGHWGLWMVDVLALMAALAFAVMAWRTRQRVLQAPPDTIWSLHGAAAEPLRA